MGEEGSVWRMNYYSGYPMGAVKDNRCEQEVSSR